MELVLYISLLLQVMSQAPAQTPADDVNAPDVEVLRFSWNEFRRPALDPRVDEFPSISKTQERVFSETINNKNSIENRSRDMRIVEQRVSRDVGEGKPDTQYRYMTEIKNKGNKIIRAVFWDYQSGDPANSDSLSHRQFRCGVKIKSNDQKRMEAFLWVPLNRTITAETGKGPAERVVLNRIEFADGTFWQRDGWVAPDDVLAWTGGSCRGF
jgi:hypothetical protein